MQSGFRTSVRPPLSLEGEAIMTKVEMTRESLVRIAGYTSLPARQLAGKHLLKKDLNIQNDRLQFLATRLTSILTNAGKKRWVAATTLRAEGYKVSDCITLMMKKGFNFEAKPEDVSALITDAKEEL